MEVYHSSLVCFFHYEMFQLSLQTVVTLCKVLFMGSSKEVRSGFTVFAPDSDNGKYKALDN